jgi:hypothetical protein
MSAIFKRVERASMARAKSEILMITFLEKYF